MAGADDSPQAASPPTTRSQPLGVPQLPFWLSSGGPISRSELTPQLSSLLFVHVPYTGDAMASTLPSDILSTLGFILKFHLLQEALPDACS